LCSFKFPGKEKPVVTGALRIRGHVAETIDLFCSFIYATAPKFSAPLLGHPQAKKGLYERHVVLKSPFKYKRHMDVLERWTHERWIDILDTPVEVVNRFAEYVANAAPAAIEVHTVRYEHEEFGWTREAREAELARGDAKVVPGRGVSRRSGVPPEEWEGVHLAQVRRAVARRKVEEMVSKLVAEGEKQEQWESALGNI
jgi:ribosomal protein S10